MTILLRIKSKKIYIKLGYKNQVKLKSRICKWYITNKNKNEFYNYMKFKKKQLYAKSEKKIDE